MRFIFLGLAALMFVAWLGAFVVYRVTAKLIHLLLFLAAVFLLIHFLRGFQ